MRNFYKYASSQPNVNQWIRLSLNYSSGWLDVFKGSGPDSPDSVILKSYFLEYSITNLTECPPLTIQLANLHGFVDDGPVFLLDKACSTVPSNTPRGHIMVFLVAGLRQYYEAAEWKFI